MTGWSNKPFPDSLDINSPHLNLSSFSDFLSRQAPQLLPGGRDTVGTVTTELPHGTTIVALKYPGGVLIAGDRRATQGNMIASRDVEIVLKENLDGFHKVVRNLLNN